MRSCYIGVGGIGCRQLKKFEKEGNNQGRFIYMDAVPEDLRYLGEGENYALTNQKNGCGQRIIGKDEIKAVIYNGAMPNFLDEFFLGKELEVIFITSTFGGFGSAAIYELSDYYGAQIKHYRQINGMKEGFSCKVIAFPLQNFEFLVCEDQTIKNVWSMNEIACINEFRDKEHRDNTWYQERSNCMPIIDLYVPRYRDINSLYTVIGSLDHELCAMDIKKDFYMTPSRKKEAPGVFISYATEDQNIADKLVNIAKNNGVDCWIATSNIGAGSYAKQIVQGINDARVFVIIVSGKSMLSPHVRNEINIATDRIKEGLVIMPFKIDDVELDDECRYYLGRQQFFMGNKPPIDVKIEHFVQSIKKVLEC